MKIGILGMGRIGRIHLNNIQHRIENVTVKTVINPSTQGRDYALSHGVTNVSGQGDDLFSDPEIDAVFVCSPSDVHYDHVIKALNADKAVFCEKPLDLSIKKIEEIMLLSESKKLPLMVAFNQRFEPSFAKVKEHIVAGKLGEVRSIKITSRDPAPPPISYIEKSGGLFLDMTIHDFDMARHLANSVVTEVYAKGFNHLDKKIGEAGDIDFGIVILTFANGATATIENSRHANYGYDQRLEVYGSEGMIIADNPIEDTHTYFGSEGSKGARSLDFFLERYQESYFLETKAFIDSIKNSTPPPATAIDGLEATKIALAANLSMQRNTPVKITEL